MVEVEEFDRVWPMLEPAARPRYEYRQEHVLELLKRPMVRLFTTRNSACVVSLWQYPSGLRVGNVWLAGGNLDELRDEVVPQAVAWGKKYGVTQARITGRRGWLRAMPGWRELGTVMARDI